MPIEFKNKNVQEQNIERIRIKEEEEAVKKIADAVGLPYINLAVTPIQKSAIVLVPEPAAREANIATILKKGDSVTVIVGDPESLLAKEIIKNLKKEYHYVSVFVASPRSLKKAWAGYAAIVVDRGKISGEVAISAQTFRRFREDISSIKDVKKAIKALSSQKNISAIVELLLASAISLNASDVHIEPAEKTINVRLRIDGLMRSAVELDMHAYKLLLSRIKLLSSMKLNIHDSAQDGRFTVAFKNFEIQIRSSVLPGEYGENIVLRVLNPALLLSTKQLGVRKDLLKLIDVQIQKPHGMILTTGPTGSGKTTTLYAFLKKLKTPKIKIITVEDPIEYHIEGISQTQVMPERGYTFASGLRAILRQDPNVILIGEIRDLETADAALRASLTGHLLLSTIHSNDAASVIPRLVDVGASTSTIGSALTMVIAQRLVRRVCKNCKVLNKATTEQLTLLKHVLSNLPSSVELPQKLDANLKIATAKGCEKCHNVGYKGRVGIYEVLINTPEFEKFILTSPSITEIREFVKEKGMTTLKEDGFLKVLEGITTIEEVERITGE